MAPTVVRRAIHDCLRGPREAGLSEASITLVSTRDRAAVGLLLTGLNGGVDVIAARGKSPRRAGRSGSACRCSLRISKASTTSISIIPPIPKCEEDAPRRCDDGVRGAAETLLVDRAGAATSPKPLVDVDRCRLRSARDDAVQRVDTRVKPAGDEDWDTEYEDAIIAARPSTVSTRRSRIFTPPAITPTRS